MNNVYIVNDNDILCHFMDKQSMKDAGFSKADKIITHEEFARNGCYVRLIDGNIVVGHTDTEIEIAELENTEAENQERLAGTDYKVIQAAERGEVLSETNPKLAADRQECRQKINAARIRLKELGARN